MILKLKKVSSSGFTLAEFVVTIAIMGTIMSFVLPSYTDITLETQRTINKSNMDQIKDIFFQHFYDTHMKGYPHLPPNPSNEDSIMDTEWSSTPINSTVSLITPNDLFTSGEVPVNSNGNPFFYETWIDTIPASPNYNEYQWHITITDIDEDSPSYLESITYSI